MDEMASSDDQRDSSSDNESIFDIFEEVCAICDDGGELLCCQGRCMRSFHATTESGIDSRCESLGLTDAEMEVLETVEFHCDNCKYKMHQCFACGELGLSDESRPEVFSCVDEKCRYFYHPECVAGLLHPGNTSAAEELKLRIGAGEHFVCPAHRCHVCNEVEDKSIRELQFAVCRRCPRAYHRMCLPREILFGGEGGILQRGWDYLIPHRMLIFCMDHEMDPITGRPVGNHIRFPAVADRVGIDEPWIMIEDLRNLSF